MKVLGVTTNDKDLTPKEQQVRKTDDLATQAEAQAGTDNTKYMTPLRVREAISVVKGALVYVGTSYTPATVAENLLFSNELFDSSGFHNTSTNTDRLTIPAGVSMVKVTCNAKIDSGINGAGFEYVAIRQYNSSNVEKSRVGLPEFKSGDVPDDVVLKSVNLHSSIVPVVEGDYFVVYMDTEFQGRLMQQYNTWFALEVVA